MTAFGRYSSAPTSSYDTGEEPAPYDFDDDGLPLGPLAAGERIGPLAKRGGRKTTFALSVLILGALGGCWYFYGDQLGELAQSLATPPAVRQAAALAPPAAVPQAAAPEPAMPELAPWPLSNGPPDLYVTAMPARREQFRA